jgi:hypothetical protein
MSLVEDLCRSQPDTPFLSKDSALTAFGFSFLLQYQLHTFGSSVTLPFSTEIYRHSKTRKRQISRVSLYQNQRLLVQYVESILWNVGTFLAAMLRCSDVLPLLWLFFGFISEILALSGAVTLLELGG